jgi:sugar phosphate isomerase/epimerase
MTSRRQFLATTFAAATSLHAAEKKLLFTISLAEWSFHRAILQDKTMTNLDFPVRAKRDFGIDAVEFVNQMFSDKAADQSYLGELKKVCDGEGVKCVLIMCDREGNLGDPDAAKRGEAVSNHHKWADAAKFLGCHSIRVNAATGNVGSFEEQQQRAADGLRKLSEYCATLGLGCIVENHGGLSSHGKWLAGVMKLVGLPNCGTLPDFGNFVIDKKTGEEYDRYQGVAEMMPFAKGVSAKTHEFDASGNETTTDYRRMMKIVLAAGYHGRLGIEYEGKTLSEPDGIRATKKLLETVRAELS